MIIQPIVEGYGEVQAIPILLRRFIAESGFYDIQIAPPFRRKRFELVRHDDVHRLVNLSLAREGCQGVMFIFDADDDCPKVKAPEIKRWAEEAANNRAACEVVMANREY